LHSTSGRLRAVAPFEFQRTLDFIQGFRPLAGEQEVESGVLTKALMVDGRTVLFRLRPAPGSRQDLSYELFSEEKLHEPAACSVTDQIAFFLSLEDDVGPFYGIAEKDAKFYPKVKELWGLHHVKFPSLLEISCWAILAQRVQMSVAKRMKEAITERFGGSMELEGRTYRAFPDYASLKDAAPSQLLAATRNQRSAARLGSLISSYPDLDESFLRTAPYEKAEERLRTVKGIGEWSAQFILFRGLGRIEKLQYSMKPVEKMLEEVYGPGRTLDDINAQYGAWSGYWSLYLWGSSMASRLRGGTS
jgi:DNA-3-methyladenine glycosylase II